MQVTMTMEEYEKLTKKRDEELLKLEEYYKLKITEVSNSVHFEMKKLINENKTYKRAMEEMRGKACEFCSGEKGIDLKKGLEITLEGRKLDFYYQTCACGSFEDGLKINYCPMCGKKLEV